MALTSVRLVAAIASVMCAPLLAQAQPEGRPPSPFSARPDARHALYIEGASCFFCYGGGVSYAWRPIRAFAVSGGVGASYNFLADRPRALVGPQAMLHLLLPADVQGRWSVELAAGGVLMVAVDDRELFPFPSAFAGIRRQPIDGGFVLRVGLAWIYRYGVGIGLSLGAAFK